MSKTGFRIFYAVNYVMTLLPLRVLYLFSDFFYLIIFYLIRYRRVVVETNLKNAFPEKSDCERRKIEKRFYRHLTDLIVETLKLTHMSPKEIKRRFIINDIPLFERLYSEGKSVMGLSSHYNNWEWLAATPLILKFRSLSIYRPLKDKNFDWFLLKLRTQYGVSGTHMQNILRALIRYKNDNILTISAFIADQTPPPDEHAYWTTFLNQDTGFYRGPERISQKLDMPVVFFVIRKVKRGYYVVEPRLLTEHPADEAPDYITSAYVSMLEEVIRDKPEYWLWSHRRWKHKKPVTK